MEVNENQRKKSFFSALGKRQKIGQERKRFPTLADVFTEPWGWRKNRGKGFHRPSWHPDGQDSKNQNPGPQKQPPLPTKYRSFQRFFNLHSPAKAVSKAEIIDSIPCSRFLFFQLTTPVKTTDPLLAATASAIPFTEPLPPIQAKGK